MLVRVSAMLALVPIFSQTQIPRLLRFGIGLLLAFVIARTVPAIAPLDGLGELAVAIAAQVFVGLVFGFVAFLLFTGIQFAGEIIDIQIGFAVVNIINPLTSQSVTVIGEFQLALATLLYLAADAHHALLAGIAGSFQLVPLPFAGAPELVAGDVVRVLHAGAVHRVRDRRAGRDRAVPGQRDARADGAGRAADERLHRRLSAPDHRRSGHADRLACRCSARCSPRCSTRSPHQLDTVLRAMGPAASPSPLPSPTP